MREKLREIRNKEEGFTLVELLAVIVILAIILALAVPSVGKVMEKSQESADESEVELIIDAAKMYVLAGETGEKLDGKTSIPPVEVPELISKGYLDLGQDPEGEKAAKYTGATVVINKDANGRITYTYNDGSETN